MRNIFSIKNKLFFVFIIILLLAIVPISWYGYNSATQAYISSAYALNSQEAENIDITIKEKLKAVPKDVLYLANFYALKRYFIWHDLGVNTKEQSWRQVFSDVIVDFLSTKKEYYQARVIGLDGKEIISAKYYKATDRANIIPGLYLQDKSKKSYFKDAMKLKRGQFSVSEMSLNMENGKIEKPYVPVVRYSTPVIDANGELKAVFVVNLYADYILNIIKFRAQKNANKGMQYYLVDKDGNYIFNKDKSKMWSKQLHTNGNISEFFSIKKYLTKEKGTFEKSGKIFSYYKIYPNPILEKDNYWYLLTSVNKDIALRALEDFKLYFGLIVLALFVMAFFFVRYYLDYISNPLIQVSQQLKALAHGEILKQDINYTKHDEVGEIVASSRIVVNAIEKTIHQLNAISQGDLSYDVVLLSENDSFGRSLGNMTERLQEITRLATALSKGNYDVVVVPKNSQDTLGIALAEMMQYLKSITAIAESVARGEIEISYSAKGDKDRLSQAILEMVAYLNAIMKQADAISKGDFTVEVKPKSTKDLLGNAVLRMTDILRESRSLNEHEIFLSDGEGELSKNISGLGDTQEIAKEAISTICRYIKAATGVIYIPDEESKELQLIASYAFVERENLSNLFRFGEGIIGQVALEKEPILLRNIEDENYKVETGTTKTKPKNIYAFALLYENRLYGVVEIMSFENISDIEIEYLQRVANLLATALYTSVQNMKIKSLLEQSQKAFEELQVKSEELQESNVQMEEQQQQLKIQSKELQSKNETLAQAKEEIDKRAEELERASKYKSEFLANMSHELRTPLNSIILLSKLLSENSNNDLSDDEVEQARVINKAGNNLLVLINDILDLTKIESGNMELIFENVSSQEIAKDMQDLFNPIAESKNIDFIVQDNFKSDFETDRVKLEQVIKNFLSNAFKFTKEGSVTFSIMPQNDKLVMSVEDSGIGIEKDKLNLIFEAFKQVDGTISREYGGTGLGLSISKEIVTLMGGVISVESQPHKGSTFSITIPLRKSSHPVDIPSTTQKQVEMKAKEKEIYKDDTHSFEVNEKLKGKSVMIVDDDSRNIFALSTLLDKSGVEIVSAFNGADALSVLEDGEKVDLILMDIMMPVMDGFEAIEKIKSDERYKNIPIIVLTAKNMPEDKEKALELGADDFVTKPINDKALMVMIEAWIS